MSELLVSFSFTYIIIHICNTYIDISIKIKEHVWKDTNNNKYKRCNTVLQYSTALWLFHEWRWLCCLWQSSLFFYLFLHAVWFGTLFVCFFLLWDFSEWMIDYHSLHSSHVNRLTVTFKREMQHVFMLIFFLYIYLI